MKLVYLLTTVVAVLASCQPASAGFLFTFSNTAPLTVGQSANVDVFVEETPGTNFFDNPLFGVDFSYSNSNASAISVTGYNPNASFAPGSILNIGASVGDFSSSSFPGGTPLTGTVRQIGTFTVVANSLGSSDLQLGLSPRLATAELVFGNSILDLTDVDLNSGGAAFTFGSTTITAVPEPSSLALVGLASAGAAGYWRKKKAKKAEATAV